MLNEFSRTQLLFGTEPLQKIQDSFVAVFGLGGVGSYTVEAIVRCGVRKIAVFDDDKVCLTNINRQLIATHKTIGKQKVEVMRDRILEINPKAEVEMNQCFYGADNAQDYDLSKYDYIVDAIDTVSSKITLIMKAQEAGVPIISCMGAGNKLDPTRFEVDDIHNTSVCRLAKVMRKELKRRGVKNVKVVYSKEQSLIPISDDTNSCQSNCVCPAGTTRKCSHKHQIPGSVSFVPSVAGLIIAGEVIKDLIRE